MSPPKVMSYHVAYSPRLSTPSSAGFGGAKSIWFMAGDVTS